MLAARAAMQPAQRAASRFAQQHARSIHIPPPRPPANFSNRVHALLRWTIARLTPLPGLSGSGGAHGARSASRLAPRPQTIKQGLSLPARVALSARPFGAPSLPRPNPLPRSMHQVGLGTARTFATTRPIFQNLVENVPVAGRAFWEAGWDIKEPPLSQAKSSRRTKDKKAKKSKQVMKPQWENGLPPPAPARPALVDAFSQFFAPVAEFTAGVTTFLDIPLAPTPTGRVPLAEFPLARAPLLPLLALAETHAAHRTHGIRVASLFRRLDAANVWTRGADFEAFGDAAGACTVLRVRFAGWTREDVRDVLGDAGRDWCAFMEVPDEPAPPSPRSNSPASVTEESASFFMPTLDVSSMSRDAPSTRAWSSAANSRARSSATSSRAWSSIGSGTSAWQSGASTNAWNSGASTPADQGETPFGSRTPSDVSESMLASGSVWASEPAPGLSFSSAYWERASAFVGDF